MKCRSCGSPADISMVDLGMSPLCEKFVAPTRLEEPEEFLPLHVVVCGNCWLAQVECSIPREEIFDDYRYLSSYSETWLVHARSYVDSITSRLHLDAHSQVVEVGSNDGYLLRWFVERGIPVLGVDPAEKAAGAAEEVGVATEVAFFGSAYASDLKHRGIEADLIVGNNVLAQVPDPHDFVAGIATLLRPDGVVTLEVPYLLQLLDKVEFDTIYHEHFSYFSLTSCQGLFAPHGLEVFDVELLPTHGGSLRLFLHAVANSTHTVTDAVEEMEESEQAAGVTDPATYQEFGARTRAAKRSLLSTLIEFKDRGDSIAGYGAAGKGNTLLNYCGIGPDFLDFIADRNPHKIGWFTPGTRIPIVAPEELEARRPHHILVLPWNLEAEITSQLSFAADWGGDFIIPIPEARVLTAEVAT